MRRLPWSHNFQFYFSINTGLLRSLTGTLLLAPEERPVYRKNLYRFEGSTGASSLKAISLCPMS